VLRWLLEHAAVGDASAYLTQPVEQMRVVGGCDCGCSSLDFVPNAYGETIIADALIAFPDGQQAGMILWDAGGQIQWLEVYEGHPGSADRFPEIANLRTWEQWGAASLASK